MAMAAVLVRERRYRQAVLRGDCGRCVGLCCVAPAFSRSADFAIDKPAGRACPNLAADFRCTIHARLRDEGFAGCVAYDCFGAGQHVTQVTFKGRDWRQPEVATQMFDAFAVMRDLHELLYYLEAAAALAPHAAVSPLRAEVDALVSLDADALAEVDRTTLRRRVGELLTDISASVRGPGPDLVGADLIGKDLRRRDLRDACLVGARLVGADLRGLDLGRADLRGTDLRAADVRGANLSGTLFMIRAQAASARVDDQTRLPPALR